MIVLLSEVGRGKVTRWVNVESVDDIASEAERHLMSLDVDLERTSNITGVLRSSGRTVGSYTIAHSTPSEHPALPVPVERWGKDHKTTLLYVESRCVDDGGTPGFPHLRTHASRHPHYLRSPGVDGSRYGTRLGDGTTLAQHDDWDCIHDFVWHGLVRLRGDNLEPHFEMTEAGLAFTAELRAERARRAAASA